MNYNPADFFIQQLVIHSGYDADCRQFMEVSIERSIVTACCQRRRGREGVGQGNCPRHSINFNMHGKNLFVRIFFLENT